MRPEDIEKFIYKNYTKYNCIEDIEDADPEEVYKCIIKLYSFIFALLNFYYTIKARSVDWNINEDKTEFLSEVILEGIAAMEAEED
jgi:hypothetical protein